MSRINLIIFAQKFGKHPDKFQFNYGKNEKLLFSFMIFFSDISAFG